MEKHEFGRENFEKVEKGVNDAESSVEETEGLKRELEERLAEIATSEHIDPREIIEIAEEIQAANMGVENSGKTLKRAKDRYDTFYGGMYDHALEEDKLRDALKEATQSGDYDKIIEAAENLKHHDNPKTPEGYDAEGTKELYEKFASQYKYIGGLSEGKARVVLPNGKYAFIDHDGNVVSGEYKYAGSYSEGKAWVELPNGKRAFIDHDGNVVSGEYKYAGSYSEGKAWVELPNGKYAFIDHDGNVIPFKE